MDLDVVLVAQRGRLAFEAALLAVTLRHASPRWSGRLLLAEPQPGPLWPEDPRVDDAELRALLDDHGAEWVPFESRHFGAAYPHGNKIEALHALGDRPFLFLDSDTVVTGELADVAIDPARPSASMKRENTWPTEEIYGPTVHDVWAALYAARGLDLETSLDRAWPHGHWRRYLYFNAGWFFGASAARFGEAFEAAALLIREGAGEGGIPELACQPLDPWLDQAALPLAVHELGGGRPGAGGGIADGILDGTHTFHWRHVPLMYATAPDHVIACVEEAARTNPVKKVLKRYDPFRKFIYQPKGWRARALFDRGDLPRKEQQVRNRLKREKLWTQR
ncbi:hypothetical protein [Jannaschia sp. W003]|uniref:hypothetical protein n=1 Tax=Jannaschia sp. W003 TaxID=2867012 RepID=UPI0021A86161|nr:hypothetical protein [Jannaschia sp. W003]UWQ21046.1 hypothetical protein K3554_13880 [Jannaschia sp. W003]